MVLANSQWFSPILNDSWISLALILNSDSHWFLLILTDSQWFSLILTDSGWFSPIFDESQISLELILLDSWLSLNPHSHWFLPIFNDSQWFSMILTDSWWFLNKSGIDSHWFSNKSKPWFSLFLTDSQWFSVILLQPQFLTNFHKQGTILKLRISPFQLCINHDDLHNDSHDLHWFACLQINANQQADSFNLWLTIYL